MKNIDFLPSRYREHTQLRRVMIWRIAAITVLALIITVAHASQVAMRRSAAKQLAAVEPQYIEALATSARLQQLQSELAANETFAELYTYLQHPWPTTQLLTAISQTLPENLTLTEIKFARRTVARVVEPITSVPAAAVSPVEPARKDLQSLRDEMDAGRLVITLHGRTTDVSALQQYVQGFARSPFFSSAKLDSLESLKEIEGAQVSRFEMLLEVRPGFGQAGGPEVVGSLTKI